MRGLRIAAFAGIFVGALIAIMRYGVYHSVGIETNSFDNFNLMILLGLALDIFIVLAGLLCGYMVVATATGAKPLKDVFGDALLAGVVAGLVNALAMVLIYWPQTADRWNYDVLNLALYGLWYFVQIVVLSLAGGAIYLAFVKRPRRFTFSGGVAGLVVGIAGAGTVALAYYVQSLAVETYHGLLINGSYDSLLTQFLIDAFVLAAGVAAGFAVATLISKTTSSVADFVISGALAGLLAGFFGLLVDVLIGLGAPAGIYLTGLSGYDWLNMAMQILYGAAMLTTLAIGGSVIYALLHGEIRLLSAEPGETSKQP